MKIEARPWTPQDLIDDLQDIINEESKEYLNTRRTTLEMALAYLKEHFTEKWIPVSERLPKEYTKVLAIDRVTGKVDIAQINAFGCFVYADGRGHGASHWMPLPNPPKED